MKRTRSLESKLNKSSFLLSKWYLDCVSDDGEAFIGYAASLHWRGVVLHYSSTLRYEPGRGTETSTSIQRRPAPEVSDSAIHWSSRPLRFDGTWKALAAPIRQKIFESNSGIIEWHCAQPHSRAELRFGEGHLMQGLGYVEQLTMTVPAWRLPIDELRWGDSCLVAMR